MRSGLGAWKRWPWVKCPAAVSSSVAGTTSCPNSITSQCTGRTNIAEPAPQCMRRGIGRPSSAPCTMPGSSVVASSPGLLPSKNTNVPLPSSRRRSASTCTPQLWAKASAARVGAPAASKAALTGGPLRLRFCSGWRLARRLTHTARRRGVA